MRSLKHTHNFKYTKYTRVFDGLGDNAMELGQFIRAIQAERASGKHYELANPRGFLRLDPSDRTRTKLVHCYSIRYYTRQLIGPKEAA